MHLSSEKIQKGILRGLIIFVESIQNAAVDSWGFLFV